MHIKNFFLYIILQALCFYSKDLISQKVELHKDFVEYYTPQNIEKINTYNRYVSRLHVEVQQHIKQIKNKPLSEEERKEKIQALKEKTAIQIRQKHIPLHLFVDPYSMDDGNQNSQLLNSSREGEFINCTTINVIKKVLEKESGGVIHTIKKAFGWSGNFSLEAIAEKNRLLFFEGTDIVMFVPKWFFDVYDFDMLLKNYKDISDVLASEAILLEFVEGYLKNSELAFSVNGKNLKERSFADKFASIFTTSDISKNHIWDMFISGHGGTDFIAGLPRDEFLAVLLGLSDSISMGSVFVQSCYIGGKNAGWIEEQLKVKEKKLSYHLVLALIGEVPFNVRNQLIDEVSIAYFEYIRNFFLNAAQLDAFMRWHEDVMASTTEKGKFSTLILSMLNNGFISQASPYKSEFLPQFLLKGSSRFESLNDTPGYFFIDQEMEKLEQIIINEDIHTIVFMTNHIKNVIIFPEDERSDFKQTFVTIGEALKGVVIESLTLKYNDISLYEMERNSKGLSESSKEYQSLDLFKSDSDFSVRIYNFLGSFQNDLFKNNIKIKDLYVENDMHIHNLSINNTKINLPEITKLTEGSFVWNEQNYKFLFARVPLHDISLKYKFNNKFYPIVQISKRIVFEILKDLEKFNKDLSNIVSNVSDRSEIKRDIAIKLVQILKNVNGMINKKDENGNTIFHYASMLGLYDFFESASKLFRKEVLLVKNNGGQIPLDIAKEYSQKAKEKQDKLFYNRLKYLYDRIFKLKRQFRSLSENS